MLALLVIIPLLPTVILVLLTISGIWYLSRGNMKRGLALIGIGVFNFVIMSFVFGENAFISFIQMIGYLTSQP